MATQPQIRKTSARGDTLTPAMRQYAEQKKQVPDAILLFRMGDFYETFYEDAKTASRVLNIALTARSKGDNPIPLAGIPYHALESYLNKLVAAGYKVAISEQIEDPKQAKGVVKREIVRIVTAGTLTDETLLDARSDNTLASIALGSSGVGLSMIELASGRFQVFDEMTDGVLDELVRAKPAELLIDDEPDSQLLKTAQELHELCGTAITRRPSHEFGRHRAVETLHRLLGVATLEGFGIDGCDASVRAAGAVVGYLEETQKTTLQHVARIERPRADASLLIDHNTWRSLEIERTIRTGDREGSLLSAVDRTAHAAGSRRLRRWLCKPLVNVDAITQRQDAVGSLVESTPAREALRDRLRGCADIERIASRIALARANPRDLAALASTLRVLPNIQKTVASLQPRLICRWREATEGLESLADLLSKSLQHDPPLTVREGGIIAEGYNAELDELRSIRSNGQAWLAEYQKQQIEQTGIPSLKVAFNRVFGFYIEISNTYRDQVPAHYVRKQTIKSAERYITDELKTYENKVLTAEEEANDLECRLFESLREQTARQVPRLLRAADALGCLDAVSSFAELAVERRYCRPTINNSCDVRIIQGRHPVLEQSLREQFVPNDIDTTTGKHAFVITGPNMSGKSTYMRQTALLTLLAQVGSYVPAEEMVVGVVDRLFARVGASDDLSRRKSTFMVEMTEAANILNNATKNSLVILDEIGRGTSTFDGLSLAWAITEHLASRTGCRTLVATHYHELIELGDTLRGVGNCNVSVREWPDAPDESDRIVFLHRIVPGGSDRSYGLHVAKMAGVPRAVVKRSGEILDRLQRGFERKEHCEPLVKPQDCGDRQLPLFVDPALAVADEIAGLDLDRTTPAEALDRLYEFQRRLNDA